MDPNPPIPAPVPDLDEQEADEMALALGRWWSDGGHCPPCDPEEIALE